MKNPSEQTETPESDNIRSEIEQTRESMDETLDKIGEHMKPRHFFDDVLNWFQSGKEGRGMTGKVTNAVVGVVREHPIPTLLIGAGIAWAIYEERHRDGSRRSGNGNRQLSGARETGEYTGAYPPESSAQETEPSMKEKIGEKVSAAGQEIKNKSAKLGEQISEGSRAVGRKASEISHNVADSVKRGYQTSRDKFVQVSDENPLCVGAGFLAAGVLLGLALPATSKEDQWVGQASDRLKQRARDKGQDLMNRGKQVASAATDAARKAAEEQGLTSSAG